MAKKRPKVEVGKYNMGSYVSYSQQPAFGHSKPENSAGNALSSGASMAATGATIGGPWGAAIGGILGLGMGLFGANKQRREYNRALKNYNKDLHSAYSEEYNAMVDTTNENPYGSYQLGGDILNPKINIEAGEMQIDPETGKILRKFTGINPETGGKYEPHAKSGKDSENNLVTAEEGTFIITKGKAKEYEDAVKNNDTLHKNSIIHNIRNKKRQSFKYQDGGIVRKNSIDFRAVPMGITPNTTLSTAGMSPTNTTLNTPALNITGNSFNWGNALNTGMSLIPGVTNIMQGLNTPTQLPQMRPAANTFRRETLANMPRDINYNPLFNRIYRDRNSLYNQIDETTSSSAIGRANKQNIAANTIGAIQDAYFQGEDINNNIRAQRSSMYNQLGEADRANAINTFNTNTGINLNNLQIREGRRQQFNYGLSQFGELNNNRIRNEQLRRRDLLSMGIIGGMYPALTPLINELNLSR